MHLTPTNSPKSAVGDGDGFPQVVVAGQLGNEEYGEVRAGEGVGLLAAVGGENADVSGLWLFGQDWWPGDDPIQATAIDRSLHPRLVRRGAA